MTTIKQGDAYALPVEINLDSDTAINIDNVETVEFVIGNAGKKYRMLYPGDVSCVDGSFYLPITQEQTFSFIPNSDVQLDIRVKYKNGDVIGIKEPVQIKVIDAKSEEIL